MVASLPLLWQLSLRQRGRTTGFVAVEVDVATGKVIKSNDDRTPAQLARFGRENVFVSSGIPCGCCGYDASAAFYDDDDDDYYYYYYYYRYCHCYCHCHYHYHYHYHYY